MYWRKMGKAYRFPKANLWIKRYGSRWYLMQENTDCWTTLGKFATLTKAKEAGVIVMEEVRA